MTAINKKKSLYVLAQESQAGGTNDAVHDFLEIYSSTEVDAISGGLGYEIQLNDADIAQLQTDVVSLSAAIDINISDISGLEVDVVSLSAAIDTNSSDITSLNTDIQTVSASHDGLASDVTEISAAVQGFQDAIDFGDMYIDEGTTSTSISAGATYTPVTQWNTDGVNGTTQGGVTPDKANNEIVLGDAGKYYISSTISFTSDTNNVVLIGSIFLDGVEQPNVHLARKVGTGSDLGSASMSGIIVSDSANEPIDLRLRHDAGGAVAITLEYSNISVFRIGD